MGLQPISFSSALFPSPWLFGHSHCFLLLKLNWWINCLMLTGWATTAAKPIVCLRQIKCIDFFFPFYVHSSLSISEDPSLCEVLSAHHFQFLLEIQWQQVRHNHYHEFHLHLGHQKENNLMNLCCCCVSGESGAIGGYTHGCSATENNPYLVSYVI